jgi:hypothetical protein
MGVGTECGVRLALHIHPSPSLAFHHFRISSISPFHRRTRNDPAFHPVLDNLIAPFHNIQVAVTIESIRIHEIIIATSSTSVGPITAFPGFCPTTLSSMVRTTPYATLGCCV